MAPTEKTPASQFESQSPNQAFWDSVALVLKRRRFIVILTAIAAVTSVIVSLLLPKSYTASTTLILPTKSDSGLSTLLSRDLSSAASSIISGVGSGDYSRYLTILMSRTAIEHLVSEFDLITVYDLADAKTPLESAIELALDNIEFYIDSEYDFLQISVTDRDPQRASDMANFMTAELNRINGRLSSEVAGNFRRSVEGRYREAKVERDSLFQQVQEFQKDYGIFDLEAQTQVFFEQVGNLRATILQLEIEYESLRERYGADNQQVKTALGIVSAARSKYSAMLDGNEAILPVSQDTIPTVVRQYADLELNRVIQTKVAEVLAPLLEQAKFDELKTVEAVQVVDVAIPPAKKSKPKRAVICIVGTLSAFALAVLYVLGTMWIRRAWMLFRSRLEATGNRSGATSDLWGMSDRFANT